MKVRFRATEVTEYEFDTGDVSPAFIRKVLHEGKGFGPGDFHLQDFARGNLIRYDIEYVELESSLKEQFEQEELDFVDEIVNERVTQNQKYVDLLIEAEHYRAEKKRKKGKK